MTYDVCNQLILTKHMALKQQKMMMNQCCWKEQSYIIKRQAQYSTRINIASWLTINIPCIAFTLVLLSFLHHSPTVLPKVGIFRKQRRLEYVNCDKGVLWCTPVILCIYSTRDSVHLPVQLDFRLYHRSAEAAADHSGYLSPCKYLCFVEYCFWFYFILKFSVLLYHF